MRIFALALVLGWIVLSSFSSPVQAQTEGGQTRCLLLGPLVISGYLELFSQVAQKKRDQVGIRASQVANLIELYDRLGCGTKELIATVECLSTAMMQKNTNAPIRLRAQGCMRKSGMPVQ